ncbi:BlaI/MecI/CopY family transcriptional regulator [Paenibacillus jilunlii]|uniref:BlaI family transcriptional regulator n=1 Tax=Paenibacillus jilunlii TaxID=682956 RepID=A0A1G9NJA4_9BACL|nr:BlaI/MecI/CopY family transcriptional regulator [Paenibacillus jilunlii]KWX77132.1 BlaI family transcriptional regulator [Paenibacillus jilunlii]SDL86423.1 Predicted transcriptional regulator [Paenibacillus jilunlii]
MEIKLYDSELKVMEILWREGMLAAGDLAAVLNRETGWNRNTTYTVIKKLIVKGAIQRTDPGFVCTALIPKEQVQTYETKELINKMYNGSAGMFFSAFLNEKNLSKEDIDKLKKIVESLS